MPIYIYDKNGVHIATSDDQGAYERVDWNTTYTGRYYFYIPYYSSYPQPNTYTLQYYSETLPTISGYVRDSSSTGISGVTMTGWPGTDPVTNSSGYYSNTVSNGWSGTITPSKTDYTFSPTSKTYSNVTSDKSNEDYVGTPPPLFGTTIITHGFLPGDTGIYFDAKWVESMAEAIAVRAGKASIWLFNNGNFFWTKDIGPAGEPREHIILFDWVEESDNLPQLGYSEAAGDTLFANLMEGEVFNYWSLDNLHFIGHSRGCVVNSMSIRRFAEYRPSINVEHVTTLDPHPVLGSDPDNTIYMWNNVVWADNYWRSDGILDPGDFDGETVIGAYNNPELDESILSGEAYPLEHSDVHLWYHGTIDLSGSVADDGSKQGGTDWYTGSMGPRVANGFYFSRLGGGVSSRPSEQGVKVNPSNYQITGIFNGNFDSAYGDAGWAFQGGGGEATISNGYLKLHKSVLESTWRQHNRFYIPDNATEMTFKIRIVGHAASAPFDRFEILVDSDIIASETTLLDQQTYEYELRTVDAVPYRGSVKTLAFRIVDDSGGINVNPASQVWIDDVNLMTNGTPIVPNTPNPILPVDDATLSDLTPFFDWSAFQDGGDGETQAGYQLRVRCDTDGNVIVYDTGFRVSTLGKTHTYSPGSYTGFDPISGVDMISNPLEWGRHYHWHVRYMDSGGDWSEWSADDPNPHQDFYTPTLITWYRDADGDEYGDLYDSVPSPTQPPGYVLDYSDCDDSDITVHPGATELCDGIDNDCDPSTPDGSDDPGVGASCDGTDSDLCAEGTNSCSGGALICSDNTGDNLDLCDGVDNDCDPSSADGSEDPLIGASCDGTDSDLCQEGTNSCSAGTLVCSDNTSDNLDLCNGVDDDCDPASNDGDEDPLSGTACDGADPDLCAEGINSCSAGTFVCSDTTGDSPDICDGIDNDCDPSSADGSEDPLIGVSCDGTDSDLCEEGTNTCSAGTFVCSDNTGDNLEIPDDDIDQDCNGFDTITCIEDLDQDGYGTDVGTMVLADDGSCDISDFESYNSDDCNDNDASINPGATEVADDGIDQDCSGDDLILLPAANVAFNKTASQSNTSFGGVPNRAVDGNTDGDWAQNSITCTNNQLNPWWQVDLGTTYNVSAIEVWNRTGYTKNRLDDFYVFVSDTPFASTDLTTTLNDSSVWSMHVAAVPDPQILLPVGLTGRYVRIQLGDTNYLSLAEVKVFGEIFVPSGANVAFNKTASQSNTSFGGVPNRAVDGNTDGDWAQNSITCTNNQLNPWWQVDLGTTYNVSAIEVWNRTGYTKNRLDDFYVFVSDTPFASTDLTTTLNDSSVWSMHVAAVPDPQILLPVGLTGRYVRIQLGDTNYLSLAEVKVFGEIFVPSGANVAFNKTASQSNTSFGGVPNRAVDGNTDGDWAQNSITCTNNQLNPWWQVDLGTTYDLNGIEVWNRTDSAVDRLDDFYIFVSDIPFASADLTTTLNDSSVWSMHVAAVPDPQLLLPVGLTGRYVRIQLGDTNYLSLAEVKVFGEVFVP